MVEEEKDVAEGGRRRWRWRWRSPEVVEVTGMEEVAGWRSRSLGVVVVEEVAGGIGGRRRWRWRRRREDVEERRGEEEGRRCGGEEGEGERRSGGRSG